MFIEIYRIRYVFWKLFSRKVFHYGLKKLISLKTNNNGSESPGVSLIDMFYFIRFTVILSYLYCRL